MCPKIPMDLRTVDLCVWPNEVPWKQIPVEKHVFLTFNGDSFGALKTMENPYPEHEQSPLDYHTADGKNPKQPPWDVIKKHCT